MNGKGSRRRPENRELIDRNWPLGEPKCKDTNFVTAALDSVVMTQITPAKDSMSIAAKKLPSHYDTHKKY